MGADTLHKLTPTVKSFTSYLALFAYQRCEGLVAGSRNASVICPIHHPRDCTGRNKPVAGSSHCRGEAAHISNVEGGRKPRLPLVSHSVTARVAALVQLSWLLSKSSCVAAANLVSQHTAPAWRQGHWCHWTDLMSQQGVDVMGCILGSCERQRQHGEKRAGSARRGWQHPGENASCGLITRLINAKCWKEYLFCCLIFRKKEKHLVCDWRHVQKKKINFLGRCQ